MKLKKVKNFITDEVGVSVIPDEGYPGVMLRIFTPNDIIKIYLDAYSARDRNESLKIISGIRKALDAAESTIDYYAVNKPEEKE